MNVCVIHSHPKPYGSLNYAFVEAYVRGAESAGHAARVLDLYRMHYETCLILADDWEQPLEPDLLRAQETIQWCDHLAVIFPLWCNTTPARLTGFIERAFAPIAARFVKDKWQPLLTGRSARVLITADAPKESIEQADSARIQVCSMLYWAGMDPVEYRLFDLVAKSTLQQRKGWIKEVEHLGANLP